MIVCPKCGYTSGNDWGQCDKQCPMRMSPHYDPHVEAVFAEIPLDTRDDNQ